MELSQYVLADSRVRVSARQGRHLSLEFHHQVLIAGSKPWQSTNEDLSTPDAT